VINTPRIEPRDGFSHKQAQTDAKFASMDLFSVPRMWVRGRSHERRCLL